MRTVTHLFAVFLVGCATRAPSPTPQVSRSTPASTPPAPQAEARSSPPIRAFGSVGALQASLALAGREDEGDAACLFRRIPGEAPRFVGRFAPAVHPLASPVQGLAATLRGAGPVDVLTRYGRYGRASERPVFAAWTDAPPPRQPVLLALTAEGPLVRSLDERTSPAVRLREDPSAVAQALHAAGYDGVFVAADAELPLATLVTWLDALDAKGLPCSLASALPVGVSTAVKALPASVAEQCSEGLPEERGELGELTAAALRAGLAPVRSELVTCLGAGSIASAHGGRLQLALRIDAQGRVTRHCVVASSMPDEGLLACVMARVAALRFEPPRPSGTVDVELPLNLQPIYAAAPRGVCAD